MKTWILVMHLLSGDVETNWFEPFASRVECLAMVHRLYTSGYRIEMECKRND